MDIDEEVLLVHQLVDFSETLLPFEARNRYEIRDQEGKHLYFAFELGGRRWYSWLIRSFLVSLRPFEMRITNKEQKDLLTINRPFRFYFHRLDVYEKGRRIGYIQRKFSLINKLFVVSDKDGKALCELKGPIWKPWTFNIIQNKTIYGKIRKAWRGWLGEVLTDSDTFGIQFPGGATSEEKKILLAAVFLIDFIYFEGNSGMNYAPDINI